MKDTIRLILSTKCNLACTYCCNEIDSIKSEFINKSYDNIDFTSYSNVCLTGGEPFIDKTSLYSILMRLPNHLNLFIYTNGLLIEKDDIKFLEHLNKIGRIKLGCMNIGLYYLSQLDRIINIEKKLPTRFMIQDKKLALFLEKYPARLNQDNTKPWYLNDCMMQNEDWVLLNDKTDIEVRNEIISDNCIE